MIKKIAFLFILFITILPFKSIADERYLIFNSIDDYINMRSSPNGKVLNKLYRMDLIITFYNFSQNNVKDKWISTDYGYIHQSQVKDISANEFNSYIKQTILDEINKIDNETVKKEILGDKKWIDEYKLGVKDDYATGVLRRRLKLINHIIHKEYSQALEYVAFLGMPDTFVYLLNNGAEINSNVKVAEDNGDFVDSEDVCGLEYIDSDVLFESVIGANNNKINKIILDSGLDFNHRYHDPVFSRHILTMAIEQENIELVNLLLEHNADVNISMCNNKFFGLTSVGASPLQAAIAVNRLDIVKILVERGANVNVPIIVQDGSYDITGELPLDFAINKGYTDIAEYLKSHNAKKYKELK